MVKKNTVDLPDKIYRPNAHLENGIPKQFTRNLESRSVMWWEGRESAEESGRFGWNVDLSTFY